MSDFGEYYTAQQSDGTWICAAHYDNDVLVKGDNEAEALQNMILALHHVNGVHCVQYMKNEPDLKAFKKARAVLAENDDQIADARRYIKQCSQNGARLNTIWGHLSTSLVSLADALGSK